MEFGGQLGFEVPFLGDFDREMLELIGDVKNFQDTPIQKVWDNDGDQILAYMRKDLVLCSTLARRNRSRITVSWFRRENMRSY